MQQAINQAHLTNILNCIHVIDDHCTDLTQDQMRDDEFRMTLYRNLTMLGMEASQVQLEEPSLRTLSSFEKADFINGLGRDTYAVYNFVVNDLQYLKKAISDIAARRVGARGKENLAMA